MIIKYWTYMILALCGHYFLFVDNPPTHGPVHEEINKLSQLIEVHPDSIFLYAERGLLYQEDEDWKSAIADFEKILTLDETIIISYFSLAESYYHIKAYQQAKHNIQRYLYHAPNNGFGHSIAAKIYHRTNEKILAISHFQKAIELKKNHVQTDDFIDLANVYKDEDAWQALQILEKGIAIIGPVIALQTQVVELSNENKWYGRSLKMVDQILLKASRKEYWLLQKAKILENQGAYQEAKNYYKNCLSEIAGLKPKIKETDFVKNLKSKAEIALQVLNDF